jgi:hypothetical protein
MHMICGMHALCQPHCVLRDRGILRIADYHPHRVAQARAQGACASGGPADDDNDNDTAGEHQSQQSRDNRTPPIPQIPYAEKDIPLPDGLSSEHVRCVLCEDVVMLFEVSPSTMV